MSAPVHIAKLAAALVLAASFNLTGCTTHAAAPEALLDFCNERMAHFAVPRYLRFVDSLPKSHAQRILKQELNAEGTEADGVWDRESVGYKVRR